MNFQLVSQRVALCVGVLAAIAGSASADMPILTAADIPAGCHYVAGLHAAGSRSELFYSYTRYAAFLPPLARKVAHSYQCGSQTGSLLYFEYRSEADRDQAELFAKPVLSKEEGVQAPEFREWANGFVVASFKQPPTELLAALDQKISGGSTAAIPTPRVPVTPPAVASTPVAVPVTPAIPPPALPSPPASVPVPVSTPAAPVTPTPPPPPVVVPIATPPAPTMPPLTFPTLSPPLVEPPAAKPLPPAPRVIPNAVTPISGTVPDVPTTVLDSYATALGCSTDGINDQIKTVCALFKDFAAGTAVDLPFKNGVPMIGPIYTIDSYGRLTDLHYDVLMGTPESDVVSFFALKSTGGEEDFEIQNLLDARKAGKELPANNVAATITQLGLKKHLALGRTTGPSVMFIPGGTRKVYVRKSGDHLILAGPMGTTVDEQTRSSLVIAPLY